MTEAPPEIDALDHRHLLGLSTYSAEEIRLILRTAREFREVLDRPIKRVPSLRGVTVVNRTDCVCITCLAATRKFY